MSRQGRRSNRARELLAEMTVDEKVGQMMQADLRYVSVGQIAELALGSVLSGGGGNPAPNTPRAWRSMVTEAVEASRRSRLGIPILYGTDAVHGHSNVYGATIFPHNIGLGATDDPDLVRRVHEATAIEVAATGVHWTFAPTVAVAQDPRWGRCYESFGSDPDRVSRLSEVAVAGLNAGGVIGCAKHFVGDGGTEWGTASQPPWMNWWSSWGDDWKIDQGDTRVDEDTLRRVHLAPYVSAVEGGVATVMASYSSWRGDKLHGHRYLLTDVLKGELGFDGFVVSDWLGVDQLAADPVEAVAAAISAGIDMIMSPIRVAETIDHVLAALERGLISADRIDDAVLRVLSVKESIGLLDARWEPAPIDLVGSASHREIARAAAAASAVLLKSTDGCLPLHDHEPVLVVGRGVDDIGLQCGGWTIDWDGGKGPITTGTTIYDGLVEAGIDVRFASDGPAPVGLVVIAEDPYVEGDGDKADIALGDDDERLIRRIRPLVDRLVVVIMSGRPLILSDSVVDLCDALVAAWLPGSEGGAIADVLTGARRFVGSLPRSWEPQWPLGHGLSL